MAKKRCPSISVRAKDYERWQAEAAKRGVSVASLVEEATRDVPWPPRPAR